MNKSIMIGIFSISSLIYGGCVQDGMNLWRLTENVSCSVGAVCEIKQTDITPGLYFISNAGHYKLCENVTGPASIVINSSDVILDLGGYYAENVAIDVNSDIENIIIRNGTLKNTPIGVDIRPDTRNILIENLVIDTIVPNLVLPLINFAFRISEGPVTGVTLRNVSIYNGCPQNIIFSGLTPDYVTDIVLENVSCIGTNSAYTVELQPNVGIIYMNECQNVVLNHVSLINQIGEASAIFVNTCQGVQMNNVEVSSALSVPVSPKAAIIVVNSNTVLIQNSLTESTINRVYNVGFLTNASNVTMENCSSSFNSNTGYSVSGSQGTFKNLISLNNSISGFNIQNGSSANQFINCTSSFNAGNGFVTGAVLDSILFDGCIASFNTVNGFAFNATSADFFVNNCKAHDNGANGFTAAVVPVTMSYCESVYNGTIGFALTPNNINTLVLRECFAGNNTGSGVDVGTGLKVFLIDTRSTYNVAALNGAADVVGAATIVTF